MDSQLACLQRHVDQYAQLLSDDNDSLNKEYKLLREKGSKIVANTEEYDRSVGSIAENRAKNRYRDIVPFDATRVKLSQLTGKTNSDYINANYVQGIYGSSAYIASQAPLPNTVADFWRMLWEVDVRVVLMACNEFEAKKSKCTRYWPNSTEADLAFGDITVTLTSTDERDGGELLVRRLQAECDGTRRTIMHYHYTAWPDHGTPQNMAPILDMLSSARAYQPQDDPPIVVHCSAGCGRTGTLLAIDYVRNLLKEGKITDDLSLFDILVDMRQQRQSLIQTPGQYKTVYQAIMELFQQKLTTHADHLYENFEHSDSNFKKERTQKSLKENSAIAHDCLSSLSEDAGTSSASETAEKVKSSTPPVKPARKKTTIFNGSTDNNGQSSSGDYVNTSLGQATIAPVPPMTPTRTKAISATISLNEDGDSPTMGGSKPLPPTKPVAQPRPSIPDKPNVRQPASDPDILDNSTTPYSQPSPTPSSKPAVPIRPTVEPPKDLEPTPPIQWVRPKNNHLYSEVDYSCNRPNQSINDNQYSLAGEAAPEGMTADEKGVIEVSFSRNEYSLAGETIVNGSPSPTEYHLAEETNYKPADSQGQKGSFSRPAPTAEEDYSYADVGKRRFPRSPQQSPKQSSAPTSYSLAMDEDRCSSSPSINSVHSEYSLAEAPPPLPEKTDGAYIHGDAEGDSYSAVEYTQNGVNGGPKAFNIKASTIANPVQGLFKFSSLKPNKKSSTMTANSSCASATFSDEIMYRGVNMAYPNRIKPLKGEKSMPLSMKR